ncbi:MAG: UDP-N-acetylmuramyl pentapeptide phosphotransferase/UDP-N-acetylglucosamine-phosphate transferase [Actinomycetia bacterium]|nr:UDP-N-acetylmuramyl pentapeptide phosphotransferase/UDP-N-acetylglucosamine-phosphate transferase [Actinomycetes bacterium]
MSVFLGFVVGVLAVRLFVGAGRELLSAPALLRPNHRGQGIPTAMGVLAIFAVVVVEGGRSLFATLGVGDAGIDLARVLVVTAVVGYGLLGLFDDLVGTQADHGFRGHLGALVQGRVTTGLVKIVGGVAIAFVLVSANPSVVSGARASGARVIVDALLVALAANLVNLFDRAPGRAIKISLVAWIPIALIARNDVVGVAIAPVMGAFTGLLGDDLRVHLMLGDTGANANGAVLGLAVVLECGTTTRTAVLVVLALLTFASVLTSFSGVIDRVPVLRRLDELGRGG